MSRVPKGIRLSLGLVTVVAWLGVTACVRPGPTATPATVPTTIPGQPTVTVNLVADGLNFDLSEIRVPAGALVTVNLDNRDRLTPHNFAVYENVSNNQTKLFYAGDIVNGPGKKTYIFTAPASSGDYTFECDVHPQFMYGELVVTTP